jgi:hypothetical protein
MNYWSAMTALAGIAASISDERRKQARIRRADAEAAQQLRQFELARDDLRSWRSGPKPGLEGYTPGPCGGCGSRETVIHRGARKGAYCRSDR